LSNFANKSTNNVKA